MPLSIPTSKASERAAPDYRDESKSNIDQQPNGTPNDVRMFPFKRGSINNNGSAASSPSNYSSTRSIPIVSAEPSLSEVMIEEEEAMAEYREHVMYQRILVARTNSEKNLPVSHHRHLHQPYQHHQGGGACAPEPLSNFLQQRPQLVFLPPSVSGAHHHQQYHQFHHRSGIAFAPGIVPAADETREEGIFELEL